MTTEELEGLLRTRAESPKLEFKQAGMCSVDMLAKDILAMANLDKGGNIIIGVTDETFERVGLSRAEELSYVADVMRDRMARFADPHVEFNVERVSDKRGLRYVVIQVFSFEEVPVICAIDSEKAGVCAATVYYRSRDRRPQSAPIATSYDMRSVIDTSTVRMMRRRLRSGYTVRPTQLRTPKSEWGDR